MTPAEYARSQGWRVGDLVTRYKRSGAVYEVLSLVTLSHGRGDSVWGMRSTSARTQIWQHLPNGGN